MPIKLMFNNETMNSNFSRKIDFQQNGMKSSKGENIHNSTVSTTQPIEL